MKRKHHLLSLTFLLLAIVWTQTPRAETIDCTAITSLPYTITVQGIYCLTGNLSTNITSGRAIEIQTNNVTIDLNGFKLGGLGAGDGTEAYGIYANQKKNITIKNGIIRGFFAGIWLEDTPPFTASSGHVVKGILADGNTVAGIAVLGLGTTVSHNTVVDTGGSTVDSDAYGIVVIGSGAKVTNNKISTTTAQNTGNAIGIYLPEANYSLLQNNSVTDTIRDTGNSVAILIEDSTGVFLRYNTLANADNGLFFISSTGKYFNNLTFDVTTPFTGGTPVGNNND